MMARVPRLYKRGNVWWCRYYFAALLLLVGFSVGCVATLEDARAAKGSGMSRIYDKTYDAAWQVVIESVKASGLKLVSERKETGQILAQRAVTVFSWGENVAVFVEKAGTTTTRVEVVSKAALQGNVGAANWERRLFEDLDRRFSERN